MYMAKPAVGLGAAPVLFGTVCAAVVSTIVYVHYNQKSEKEVCMMLLIVLRLQMMSPAQARVQ